MAELIEIAFRGNRREFFRWDGAELPPSGASMVVEADRGEDLGRVHALGDLVAKRVAGVPHAPAEGTPPRRALRLATEDDVARGEELAEMNESARRKAAERVRANGLVMKLTDAEWQWDRKKLTFYFTAEKRVDFRNLVRDLASIFRARIELKQIGVRDEARRLDGIGRCGRQYCSASWLPELRPVNLGVAKDQRLSLNPSQISGACGRLMCCLRYEHDFYVQSRKRFPKEGKILATSKGEEKVMAIDIFRDAVSLRTADGESRVVPLAELRREMGEADAAAGTAGAAVADAPRASSDVGEPESEGEHVERPLGRERAERSERSERPDRPPRGDRPSDSRGPRAGAPPRGAPARPTSGGRDAGDGRGAPAREPVVGPAREPVVERAGSDGTAIAAGEPAHPAPTPSTLPPDPAVAALVPPVAGDDDEPDAADVAVPGETAEEAEQRRTRRRRGRRGGRRSRGGPTNTNGE